MFEKIPAAPKDKIFGLLELYAQDTRVEKINLTAGVYCDESGAVPVLPSVRHAEQHIFAEETSKNYVSIEGSDSFRSQILQLLLNEESPKHCDALHTPGGTGALRLAAEFIRRHFPDAQVWVSNPTWPNHLNIFKSAGLAIQEYPYFDFKSKSLVFDQMYSALEKMQRGDVILLHGCCHNPTGEDLTRQQWEQLSTLVQKTGVIPIIDCAYQGFGIDLPTDSQGIQLFHQAGIDFFVATSYSKNFGLYNERTGALAVFSEKNEANVMSQLKNIVRAIYSNPPAHGANIVSTILSTHLKTQWLEDLDTMKTRLNTMRKQFARQLTELTQIDHHFIEHQRGLFSFVSLTSEQIIKLREQYGIYMLESGRINIAGLNNGNINTVCETIAKVCR